MYPAFERGRFGRWPWCDPLIGPNQNHALFFAVAHYGFSDRRSRPFRINVFITLAVREPAYLSSSFLRRASYAAWASSGARYVPPWASSAQAVRAILLASATATTLKGRRASSCVSHGYFSGFSWARRNTECAPTIRMRRT